MKKGIIWLGTLVWAISSNYVFANIVKIGDYCKLETVFFSVDDKVGYDIDDVKRTLTDCPIARYFLFRTLFRRHKSAESGYVFMDADGVERVGDSTLRITIKASVLSVNDVVNSLNNPLLGDPPSNGLVTRSGPNQIDIRITNENVSKIVYYLSVTPLYSLSPNNKVMGSGPYRITYSKSYPNLALEPKLESDSINYVMIHHSPLLHPTQILDLDFTTSGKKIVPIGDTHKTRPIYSKTVYLMVHPNSPLIKDKKVLTSLRSRFSVNPEFEHLNNLEHPFPKQRILTEYQLKSDLNADMPTLNIYCGLSGGYCNLIRSLQLKKLNIDTGLLYGFDNQTLLQYDAMVTRWEPPVYYFDSILTQRDINSLIDQSIATPILRESNLLYIKTEWLNRTSQEDIAQLQFVTGFDLSDTCDCNDDEACPQSMVYQNDGDDTDANDCPDDCDEEGSCPQSQLMSILGSSLYDIH